MVFKNHQKREAYDIRIIE